MLTDKEIQQYRDLRKSGTAYLKELECQIEDLREILATCEELFRLKGGEDHGNEEDAR